MDFEVEEPIHAVRGSILQEGRIFTLSNFDKFYMVSAILNTTNIMTLFISPLSSTFSTIFQYEGGTMTAVETGSKTMILEIFPRR